MAANSRTSTRKTTRPAQPAELEPVDDFDDDGPDEAEAQEIEAEGHYVTAVLDGEDIRVVPPGAWRQSWQTMLASGQFNAFAAKVVHPDDLDLYFEIDPTNDQFEAFVTEAANQSGESRGKSRGPARSSRRTRRR